MASNPLTRSQQLSRLFYGKEFAKCFYLKDPPSLLMAHKSGSQLAATRLAALNGLPEPTASVRPERGFTIPVHMLASGPQWGTWVDGKFRSETWVPGGVGIYDMQSDPIALRNTTFDCVHYNLPRATLDEFTEDAELPQVSDLVCTAGAADNILHHLTQMILPAMETGNGMPQLVQDHFILMFCARVVTRYSSVAAPPKFLPGGLAPWQRRRVAELIGLRLDGDLPLSTLARECGLSASHFARSFRKSFGIPVHRYLIVRRVEKAKELLCDSGESLLGIAMQTGFSDQAAFCRAFGKLVGISPGRWRRERWSETTKRASFHK
jgi:AraC family transcriptional regulator